MIERFDILPTWKRYTIPIPDDVRSWAIAYRKNLAMPRKDKPILEHIYLRLMAAGAFVLLEGVCCSEIEASGRGKGVPSCNFHLPPQLHESLKTLAERDRERVNQTRKASIDRKEKPKRSTRLVFAALASLKKGLEIVTRGEVTETAENPNRPGVQN